MNSILLIVATVLFLIVGFNQGWTPDAGKEAFGFAAFAASFLVSDGVAWVQRRKVVQQ